MSANDMAERHTQARSITIVRHGRTAYNAAHRIQGWVDIPLDEVGLWQVNQTGEALQNLYVQPDSGVKQLVVASDLSRAMQTAHAFADRIGVPVHTDERFRERNLGGWEGQSIDELAEFYPEDFQSWIRKEGGELRHGAETHHDCGVRGAEAIRDWSRKAGPDTDLFIFAHGSVIENMVQQLLEFDQVHADYLSLGTMGNAHWARIMPAFHNDEEDRWTIMEYNHGPAVADTPQWTNPVNVS